MANRGMKNRASKPNPALERFKALIGEWRLTGKHPLAPGKALRGHCSFEWIEGGAFVKMQSRIDEPGFPEGISIFGSDDARGELFMLYFDERGVSRKYDFAFDANGWRWGRDAKDFSQRFTCTITDEGRSMVGKGEMSKNGLPWEDDLSLVYERQPRE